MGNRSFLTLVDHRTHDFLDEVADANNNLPILWKIFLADGHLGSPDTSQRVFGDAGTDGLEVPLSLALSRLKLLATFLRDHPMLSSDLSIDRMIQAVVDWFEYYQATYSEQQAQLYLSANIDELSWLSSTKPDDFIQETLNECSQLWANLHTAIQNVDYTRFDQVLSIDSLQSIYEWDFWTYEFGFCNFSDPYFSDMDDGPNPDLFSTNPEPEQPKHLTANFYTLIEGNLIGIQRLDDQGQFQTIYPAEWFDVISAGHDNDELLWLQSDERYQLARLTASGELISLTAVIFDHVHSFEGDVASININELFGLISSQGELLIEPTYIETGYFSEGLCYVLLNDRYGFINAAGKLVIPLEYHDINDFKAGIALVKKNGFWGVINTHNEWLLQPIWKEIEHNEHLNILIVQSKKKQYGLFSLSKNNEWQETLVAEWRGVEILAADYAYYIKLENDHGFLLADAQGKIVTHKPFDDIDHFPTFSQEDPYQNAVLFIITENQQFGLIDASGRSLIPAQYQYIGSLNALQTQPFLFKISDQEVDDSNPDNVCSTRLGIYNSHQQKEIIPCQYSVISPITDHKERFYGYIVAKENEDSQALEMGIFDIKGRTIAPIQYAWLSTNYDISDPWSNLLVVSRITQAWANHNYIEACLSVSGEVVWINQRGLQQSHIEYLTNQAKLGHIETQCKLGCAYRDGDGVAQDLEQALIWLTRASGHHSWDASTNQAGVKKGNFFQNLYRKPEINLPSPPSDLRLDPQHQSAQAEAIYELAMLLDQYPDHTQAQTLKRAWLEAGHRLYSGTLPKIDLELGWMYNQGFGGVQDFQKAAVLYEKSASPHYYYGYYYLGILHHYGEIGAIDLDKAIEYYMKADKGKHFPSTYEWSLALLEKSQQQSKPSNKTRMYDQAIHLLERVAYSDNEEYVCKACAALADLYITAGDRSKSTQWIAHGTQSQYNEIRDDQVYRALKDRLAQL